MGRRRGNRAAVHPVEPHVQKGGDRRRQVAFRHRLIARRGGKVRPADRQIAMVGMVAAQDDRVGAGDGADRIRPHRPDRRVPAFGWAVCSPVYW